MNRHSIIEQYRERVVKRDACSEFIVATTYAAILPLDKSFQRKLENAHSLFRLNFHQLHDSVPDGLQFSATTKRGIVHMSVGKVGTRLK